MEYRYSKDLVKFRKQYQFRKARSIHWIINLRSRRVDIEDFNKYWLLQMFSDAKDEAAIRSILLRYYGYKCMAAPSFRTEKYGESVRGSDELPF